MHTIIQNFICNRNSKLTGNTNSQKFKSEKEIDYLVKWNAVSDKECDLKVYFLKEYNEWGLFPH